MCFSGVQMAADAVEHLQRGASIGKVVLKLAQEVPEASKRFVKSRI